ncbi:MAG TPA: AAA family ATPase [Capsulimonadaceae bacterium]|jgi:NadR type nicotinamide-nucleotide adenylyltransferase
MSKRGIVIGKFLPPHAGHKLLIETAQSSCEDLVVLVCERQDQPIPGDVRAAWLREIHPGLNVRVISDPGYDDDSEFWARHTISLLGYAPDVVFSSEAYGETWAAAMGAAHVSVDKPRAVVPISATAVRNDPWGTWEFLEPYVRSYYVQRIAIVGAESTGSTTLAQSLAAHFNTLWVPEYGREYWIEKVERGDADTWRSEEFVHIAEQQCASEDRASRVANRLLICDTPAFATTIWHERYLGETSPLVDRVAAGYRYSHIFVTAADFDFVQDGYRDGEHIRDWMDRRLREWLTKREMAFTVLEGTHEKRMARAVEVIEGMRV